MAPFTHHHLLHPLFGSYIDAVLHRRTELLQLLVLVFSTLPKLLYKLRLAMVVPIRTVEMAVTVVKRGGILTALQLAKEAASWKAKKQRPSITAKVIISTINNITTVATTNITTVITTTTDITAITAQLLRLVS